MRHTKDLIEVPEKLIPRFWNRVEIGHKDKCWEWQGKLNRGYGWFTINKKAHRAHRVAYVLGHGALTNGMIVDHMCANRACVNPNHLRVLSCRDNLLASEKTFAYKNSIKTHCPQNHALEGYNLVIGSKGERSCRECKNIWSRKNYNPQKRHQYYLSHQK